MVDVEQGIRGSGFSSQESEMVSQGGGHPMDGAVSPRKNRVGGSLFLMKVILIASLMAVSIGWVLHRLLGDHIPDGVILIATKECSSLGSTWRNYEDGGGRFIVGVGTASDVRGEGKDFAVGDVGGSYSQDLTAR